LPVRPERTRTGSSRTFVSATSVQPHRLFASNEQVLSTHSAARRTLDETELATSCWSESSAG